MRVLGWLVFALGLGACGSERQTAEPAPPMPVSETVFAPALGTMDKARAVEGTLQQDRNHADAAIKAAE